ncbi:helix-turn-helix domain-containing protein, partial [Klebsiella pneumoniae]|uniref:helix-turn-helix domain-containing protein n=1 Tax=Klebsiella pneumoniae TaxID=573 RepID=UPI003EE34CA0
KWLADLPFTAEMLREREKCELRQDASRRLQWFADLRAGMDVTAAAERARISPLTIERWLEAGIEYGLDAILAEQTRINFLPADQRHAITV